MHWQLSTGRGHDTMASKQVPSAPVPELPEVEYTRRQLQRTMAGARIRRVVTRRANLRYPFPADFIRRLQGKLVRGVGRRAKYLLVDLASGDVLLMHLGMSGSFRVMRRQRGISKSAPYDNRLETHDHVVFEMSTGAVVVFTDPRRFGFMSLLRAREMATHAALGRLGPEPLERPFDVAALASQLARRKTSLKTALSDQRVIAGLGNIYVTEALHWAGLSPKRRASTLVTHSGEPRAALHGLVKAIREVLMNAIGHQYRSGAADRFDDRFLVYDREGKNCRRKGCPGRIRRIVQGGRSTFYCPVCQR